MTTQELGLQQNNFIDCFSLKAIKLSFTRKKPSLKPQTTSETEATVTVYHIDEMKNFILQQKDCIYLDVPCAFTLACALATNL